MRKIQKFIVYLINYCKFFTWKIFLLRVVHSDCEIIGCVGAIAHYVKLGIKFVVFI